MKKQPRLAFSLIELSIVILIIGILVIGVTKGSRIISESRLKSAQSLAAGSPVNSTKGLALWLDATDSKNIAVGASGSGVYANPSDNGLVTEWRDRNPLVNDKIVFTATSDAKRATFISKGLNGLPVLRFNGTTSSLSSSSPINSTSFGNNGEGTIFLVVKQISLVASSANTVFVFQSSSTNRIAVTMNPGVTRFEYGDGTSGTSSGVLIGTTNVIGTNYVISLDKRTSTQTIYLNGSSEATKSNSDILTPFSTTAFIGSYTSNNHYANVDIAELIIFNRSLKDSERRPIEQYLGQKWGIKVN